MREILKLTGLATIFVLVSCAWLMLGGLMLTRSEMQQNELHGAVAGLWGQTLIQNAPTAQLAFKVPVERTEPHHDKQGRVLYGPDGKMMKKTVVTHDIRSENIAVRSTDITVDLQLDQRRKGLMWFPLYDVDFAGSWTVQPPAVVPRGGKDGTVWLQFEFPVQDGMFDDFRFTLDGVDVADQYPPEGGLVRVPVALGSGPVAFGVTYKSRGMTEWSYRPSNGVGQLEKFALAMTTDFADIDFPAFTLSPSSKARSGDGWTLDWRFNRLVTGHGMGMVMPEPVQPGPLAASMAFSAPISLGLFMLWIYVLGLLKGIDIHPINHLFLAATFFSFHLLFSYTTDHIPVEMAFLLSSVVSLGLTITYLRLVAGPRFALFEAGGAQLLYLVGFSLAHFWEGFTGLTVTVLGIITLFALGQLTGRIHWSEVFAAGGRMKIHKAPS